MSCAMRYCWLGFTLLILAGCASKPPKVSLTDDAAANLDVITVVRPPDDMPVAVQNLGHPGMAFGLVGGAIAAADQKEKTEKLTAALRQAGYSPAGKLTDAVTQKLTAAGYNVRVQEGLWDKKDGKYVLQREKLTSETPVLVITPVLSGYVAPNAVADYQPAIRIVATLLNKDRTELYRGYHAAGWKPTVGEWKHTPSAQKFSNYDALMADPKKSAAALSDASDLISTSIAEDLRRKR